MTRVMISICQMQTAVSRQFNHAVPSLLLACRRATAPFQHRCRATVSLQNKQLTSMSASIVTARVEMIVVVAAVLHLVADYKIRLVSMSTLLKWIRWNNDVTSLSSDWYKQYLRVSRLLPVQLFLLHRRSLQTGQHEPVTLFVNETV